MCELLRYHCAGCGYEADDCICHDEDPARGDEDG